MNKPLSKRPVGIDTDILIQAYRRGSDFRMYHDPNERKQQQRFAICADGLITSLRRDERPIYLSVITLAEFLHKVPTRNHVQVTQDLERVFTIIEFNRQSASKAAEIAEARFKAARKRSPEKTRVAIKADIKIIANLIASGVEEIYFHDDNAMNIAKGFISARPLPTEPADLLDLAELNDLERS